MILTNDFGFAILDFGLGDNDVNEAEFKKRTKHLALRTIKLVESLPSSAAGQVFGKQLLRSFTSVGANYRAVCRAKSPADMINKLRIVEEEADESVAMVVASQKTLRVNNPQSKIENPK